MSYHSNKLVSNVIYVMMVFASTTKNIILSPVFLIIKAYQIGFSHSIIHEKILNRQQFFHATCLFLKIIVYFLFLDFQVIRPVQCKVPLSYCFFHTVFEVLQYRIHSFQPQALFDEVVKLNLLLLLLFYVLQFFYEDIYIYNKNNHQ